MSEEIKGERRVEETTVEQTGDGRRGVRVEREVTTEVRAAHGPTRRRNQVLAVAAVAAVALVALLYVLFFRGSAKEEAKEAPAEANPTGTVSFLMEQQWLIRMKLAQVEEQTVARQITATGRVVPAANRQAVVEAARVRLEQARREEERAKRLLERKAFSQRQVEAAVAERETAQAAYDVAVKRREVLAAARPVAPAAPSTIRVGSANSSYAVRAPLGGYVTKVHKSLGEQVQPGEGIVEISNLDEVWIEAPIFERDLNRLAGNVEATFTTAAYPGQEFRGVVVDTGSVIDEKTRAATVVFRVPNSGRALRIGMQADVQLDAGESVTAMMIPKEAVLDNEGKKIVYVLLSGEEFQRREVTVGDEYGSRVAILSGLNPGERVVTQGALQLKLQELRPAGAGTHSHET